jgi:transcriptional regulator with XRE-family HTH domain
MNEHFAEIGKRLSQYLTHKGLSQSKLARLSSTSGSQVFNMLNGTRYGVDKLLSVFRALPELNPEWLLFGHGDMEKNSNNVENDLRTAADLPVKDYLEKGNTMEGNFAENEEAELEEIHAMLQLCQAEKDGLKKILELKDELIEVLKNQKEKSTSREN